MTRRQALPLESFGPELMATLLKGASEKVTIELPYNKATRFRQRLYQLRRAMRESRHQHASLVSRVRITLEPDLTNRKNVDPALRKAPTRVTISPSDSEFGELLSKAGVDLGLAQVDSDLEPDDTDPSELDKLLGDI